MVQVLANLSGTSVLLGSDLSYMHVDMLRYLWATA